MKPRFWKPDADKPESAIATERPTSGDDTVDSAIFNPNSSLSIDLQRQRLPIFAHRTNILYLLEKYETVIIVGETGCGKSTQIPQYLDESGWTAGKWKVCVTQPRRVAVVTVAARVAEERGSFIGEEVGYSIRFDDCCDVRNTRIKFVTDGVLLKETMSDPLLSQYSVIMLDEAHERTLHTDIMIGLLKKIKKKRKDLRIIVSSATLDAEMFRDFFNTNITNDSSKDNAAILSVKGTSYPVDIHFTLSPVADYLKATIDTVMGIHKEGGPGDVLAFVTGQDEVETVVSQLIEQARTLPRGFQYLKVLPMYSGLPHSEQMQVFKTTPRNTRKVVVATNIAEASVTINGVVYVVDCGFVKLRVYSPRSGFESLVVVPISQASAKQRAGRAGRVRSGKVYRLYTEKDFLDLAPATVPEMQRYNMATVLLQLKCLGIDNVLCFSFPARPPAQNTIHGLELLYALGAVDEHGKLADPFGINMAEFPTEPMISKMLLSSGKFACSEEILTIAAMLQIQNIFVIPSTQRAAANNAKRKFSVYEGDHITLLNVFEAFIKYKKSPKWCHDNFLNYKGLCHAVKIREQLKRLLIQFKVQLVSCDGDTDSICQCIVSGFFANAACLHPSGSYRTVQDDHPLYIHPTSVLYTEVPPQWVIYHEVLQTSKDYMRDVTKIDPSWLYKLAPQYYEYGTEREINSKRAKYL